jgi:tetratricopeptide (TPR) repeat protein
LHKKDVAAARAKRILPEPAKRWIKHLLGIRNSFLSHRFAKVQMPSKQIRDEYDRLVAGNVADVLLKVMRRFYGDLGVDARSIPLVKALEAFRESLPANTADQSQGDAASVLIRFERAFALSEARRLSEALPLYRSVFRDQAARNVMPYDPFIREAIVRSGEFIGRYHDKRGEADAAIEIYREILSLDPSGLMARRLALLLARRGDWQEAAELSETATITSRNLYPHLPEKNPYLDGLKTEYLTK